MLGSAFYMVVFQVTPFDKYYEIENRRHQVEFHNRIGYSLLERGHYRLAISEFEQTLKLSATDYDSLNGQYFSKLFIDMDTPSWDPSVGLMIQKLVKRLSIVKDHTLQHIVEKYLGDLNHRIGKIERAKRHYEKALDLKENYVDALFAYGWFSYDTVPDLKKMESLFMALVKEDVYDYRGYHGYGYVHYMRAINETDPAVKSELLKTALKQSESAVNLFINQLNIVMDLGEISRAYNPRVALLYHEHALKLIGDPDISRLPNNNQALGVKLLTQKGYRQLNTIDEKRSWILYQIALDYYSLYKQNNRQEDLKIHGEILSSAKALDPKKEIIAIYDDQQAILQMFLRP